jgi:hypothetical protein
VTVFIFLGPTLSSDDARKELAAIYLPPVAQGDVYRAAKEKPFAIGIIDGYFERIPAVWHKEILWALSQKIHVFGAASMGALRAAELDRFGMQGVGEIYHAFRSGELEDDDEVAVVHGDADTGYRALSEAMVNLRATLSRAAQANVLTCEVRQRLESLAKAMFYPDRSYSQLLVRAAEAGLPKGELEAFARFVVVNRVDQKRADAVSLLHAVRDCCAKGELSEPPTFSFQHTEGWDQAVDWAETLPPLSLPSWDVAAELVSAEVRLAGSEGRAILASGFNRAIAGILARRTRAARDKDKIAKLDQSMRRRADARADNGSVGEAFERWLAEHDLTREGYGEFLERQAQVDWMKGRYREELDRCVVDELRQAGEYARLARRAKDKDRLLKQHGLGAPSLHDAGLTQPELLSWYFEQRIGLRFPSDIAEFLIDGGLGNEAALEREALREYLYAQLSKENSEEWKDGNNQGKLQRPTALP